ncbi:MAG: hypothetical protein ABH838_04785 [Actinomycetota bacterium]
MAGLRINVKSRWFRLGAVIAALVIIGLAVWWFSLERLPGYNMEPTYKKSYVEPGGRPSEYFTGYIKKVELSIIGWKMTVTLDENNSERTFLIPGDTPIWLGLVIGSRTISGRERAKLSDLKAGQRVAVFIGKDYKATRVNILKR